MSLHVNTGITWHYMMLHDLHQITCVTYNYLLLLFKKKGSTSFGCNARKFVLLYVNAWKCMLMLDWVS